MPHPEKRSVDISTVYIESRFQESPGDFLKVLSRKPLKLKCPAG